MIDLGTQVEHAPRDAVRATRAVGAQVAPPAQPDGFFTDENYVSNVEPYLFRSDLWRPFYESVATLPVSDDAVFIRTFFGSTARQCSALRPTIRTPLTGSIVDLIEDYRSGEIETQCALVERSR